MAARKVVTRATTKIRCGEKDRSKSRSSKTGSICKNSGSRSEDICEGSSEESTCKEDTGKDTGDLSAVRRKRDSGQRSHGKSENNLDKRSGQ